MPAVISKAAQSCSQRRIIAGNCAAVTVSAKIFCGVEAEGRCGAEGSDAAAPIPRADCLRRILDQPQAMARAEFLQWRKIDRLSKKMNGNDCFRSRRQGLPHAFRIYIVMPG